MLILAFDASTIACSACVSRDGTILAAHYQNVGLTHSQTLLPMIARVLSDAGCNLAQIDRIGVTVGPGSFTGIKIAAATAKGLAHRYGIPCAPISSLQALASGISFEGTVCAVEDARRDMLYNANFKHGIRLCEDRQISAEELIRTTEGPLLFCGDGSEIAAAQAEALGAEYRIVSPDRRFIRAETVAWLAEAIPDEECVSPEQLSPAYLRLPQAERERINQENRERKDLKI